MFTGRYLIYSKQISSVFLNWRPMFNHSRFWHQSSDLSLQYSVNFLFVSGILMEEFYHFASSIIRIGIVFEERIILSHFVDILIDHFDLIVKAPVNGLADAPVRFDWCIIKVVSTTDGFHGVKAVARPTTSWLTPRRLLIIAFIYFLFNFNLLHQTFFDDILQVQLGNFRTRLVGRLIPWRCPRPRWFGRWC